MDKHQPTDDEKRKIFGTVDDDWSEDELFPCDPNVQLNQKSKSSDVQFKPTDCYSNGQMQVEAAHMDCAQDQAFKDREHQSCGFSSNQERRADQEQEMKLIRKKGYQKKNSRRSTKKLCNGHKFDYTAFVSYFKSNSYKVYRNEIKLKQITSEIIEKIGKNKATTAQIASLFANNTSKDALQMSYLNCKLMKNMFEQKAAELIFKNKKLGNKTTFYLHMVNKYMRIQSMHLASRLQAR